jgi:hypothetical protein
MSTKEYMSRWRKNNKEKTKQYAKVFRERHGPRILNENEKEKQKEYMTEYQQANKDHLRTMKKLQIANNPEYAASLRRSKQEWRDKNKGYNNEYNKARKAIDPVFKLRMYLRTRFYQAVKNNKRDSALKLLGCTLEDFKVFIAAKFIDGMSWDNYGEWELDHIKPLALFNLIIIEEQIKAFHYSNFQPLWKADNRAKRDLYTP